MWGGNSVLQRICRNSHRFNIEIQILVGLVMTLHGSFEVTQRLASIGARRDTKVKIIILRMFKFIFPIKAERK
ncbi:hypothetical protein MAL08_13225 [Leptospira noguchii]|uniref:hypothetical protein n=1 Tax=Leptospira noguchii TaxID=28182 RepID=UPI001FB65C4E|nr:hypothetical protein [Leptospira noguchii]UOG37040.1 hypothetical protein MAL08_13225 [Leptospira noguchii]